MTVQELHDKFHAVPSVLNNGKAGPADLMQCSAPACQQEADKRRRKAKMN